jgi:hypothetical protein
LSPHISKVKRSGDSRAGASEQLEGAQPRCVIVDIGHDHKFVGCGFRDERLNSKENQRKPKKTKENQRKPKKT